ncbi:MAG: pirin family protein [Blastomonas sp.]
MIEKRPFGELGHVQHGWLDARHHFSFGQYVDRNRMSWGNLRVWNDDEIAPHSGFPTHPHRDMEIITFVREGAITHRDSLGNEGRTEAGDVQVMSAGDGVRHSEYNLENETTRLFQIWILPREAGGEPRWDARQFPRGARAGRLETLASGDADDVEQGALLIRADARILGATLAAGESLTHRPAPGRASYVVVSKGTISINGVDLGTRDAAAIHDEQTLTIAANDDSEFLIAETAFN